MLKTTNSPVMQEPCIIEWKDFISGKWRTRADAKKPSIPPGSIDPFTLEEALWLVWWPRVAELCAPFRGVNFGEIVVALARGERPTLTTPSSTVRPSGSWGPPPPELYEIEGLDRQDRAWLRLASEPILNDATENLYYFLESIGDKPVTCFLTPYGWQRLLAHLYGCFGRSMLGEVLDALVEWHRLCGAGSRDD